jgi:hypothetical protein
MNVLHTIYGTVVTRLLPFAYFNLFQSTLKRNSVTPQLLKSNSNHSKQSKRNNVTVCWTPQIRILLVSNWQPRPVASSGSRVVLPPSSSIRTTCPRRGWRAIASMMTSGTTSGGLSNHPRIQKACHWSSTGGYWSMTCCQLHQLRYHTVEVIDWRWTREV